MVTLSCATFRKLPSADGADIDREKAVALMTAQPSMIKRPVLDLGDRRLVLIKARTRFEAARIDMGNRVLAGR